MHLLKLCTLWTGMLLLLSVNAFSQSREHVIYAFSQCGEPAAALIADTAGNLYGTTPDGGANKRGCAFKLSRKDEGGWNETLLYSFGGMDGAGPQAGLVFDNTGNLYGTTVGGGVYNGGVVFELTPSGNGEWTETVLYNFGGTNDGFGPQCQLVFDNAGNLYGTTSNGGPYRSGTVFELSPTASGWTETILHAFAGQIYGPGGDSPAGGVVMDREGNLFGVTGFGGRYGGGTVYEFKFKDGTYHYRGLIHSFDQYDGAEPNSLAVGPDGNLYGTAQFGGTLPACDCGVVFQLAKVANGQWTESTLLSLNGNDGFYPVGPPAFDDDGDLYAAAMSGGHTNMQASGAFGAVYKLTPRRDGSWAETTLHVFIDNFSQTIDRDGHSPYAGVIVVGHNLFGTTALGGGIHNAGTVFRIALRPEREDSEYDQDEN
jgi:uncharacterized repeat protein (TIGR03803 family)